MAIYNREDSRTALPQLEKKIETEYVSKVDFSDFLIVEKYENAFNAVSSGGNVTWTETVTKKGYYPLGIVGFRAGAEKLLLERCNIDEIDSGTCKLHYKATNPYVSTSNSGTAEVYILWVKEK